MMTIMKKFERTDNKMTVSKRRKKREEKKVEKKRGCLHALLRTNSNREKNKKKADVEKECCQDLTS